MKSFEINARIKEYIEKLDISPYEFAKRLGLNRTDGIYKIISNKVEPSPKTLNKIFEAFPDLNKSWLMYGSGNMILSGIESVPVNGAEKVKTLEKFENKNGNTFLELPNGQYYMIMPLIESKVQAGFLDHYQDTEFLMDLEQHGAVVSTVALGRYVAFRVTGDSMDDDSKESIPKNSIVVTRELQRHLWNGKLRFKDFPYWVIYTTQSKMPLLKEIVEHNTDDGYIVCHSLNDSPEYSDFKIEIDEIQALFYVIDKSSTVARKNIY